jgi:hypothetical protein
MQKGSRQVLLADHAVRRWYDHMAKRSVITTDVYLRRLGHFCELNQTTPGKLVEMHDKDMADLLLCNVAELEAKHYAGSYIESTLKAVRSWLAFNGVKVKTKIKVKGARATPSLKNERVPRRDELRRVLLSGTRKSRAAVVLVAEAGLRLETLGDYKGNDGLRVDDLPEMRIEHGVVSFEKTPTLVIVRGNLRKTRHQYFTFLTEEGCEYLKDYLEERIRGGETLTKESSIITPKVANKAFIRTINIGDMIRVAVRSAGFPWRPFVLRVYFDTQLTTAENEGLMRREHHRFFMGHKGEVATKYSANRHNLPSNVVERMRSAFAKTQRYLQTRKPDAVIEQEITVKMKKQMLLVGGYSNEEIEVFNLEKMSTEDVQIKIRDKLFEIMVSAKTVTK